MSTVQCPACQAHLDVPPGTSHNAQVQCPGCDAEFVLGDGANAEIPLLIVLNDPTPEPLPSLDAGATAAVGASLETAEGGQETSAGGSEQAFAVEDQAVEKSSGGDESGPSFDMLDVHPDSTTESEADENGDAESPPLEGLGDSIGAAVGKSASPSFDFGRTPTTPSTSFGVSTGSSTRSPSKTKKQKNGMVEVIKVAGGGIAGLIIAQMILWWLPGGWHRDPFGLVPSVAGVAPFLVPARYHPQQSGHRQGGPVAQAYNRRDPPRSNDSIPKFESDLPAEDQLAGGFSGGFGGSSPPDEADHEGPEDNALDTVEPTLDTDVGNLTVGVANAPIFASAELGKSLTDSNLAFRRLLDMDGTGTPEEKKEARKSFYKQFCDLALKITYVDPDDINLQGRVNAVHRLLEEVGKHPNHVELVSQVAVIWHKINDRTSDGILLAGTVAEINRAGDLYESRITLMDDFATVVTVLSSVDPRDNPLSTYHPDSRVLILGSVIDDPASAINGYEGNEAVVIWGGYPVELVDP